MAPIIILPIAAAAVAAVTSVIQQHAIKDALKDPRNKEAVKYFAASAKKK